MGMNKEYIADWFKILQDNICYQLENEDGLGKFKEETWARPGGGGGRTRILTEGKIIEKGGVNFSAVFGDLPDNISKALQIPASAFFATGISIVMHPFNPHVPIIHMNVRYFETIAKNKSNDPIWWFGGGIDLTPHYVVKDDATWFHKRLLETCQSHDPHYYEEFKKWADDYFYNKHRQETRGVGGIFFDRLNGDKGKTKEELFTFVQEVGNAFAPIYRKFMKENHDKKYTQEEKHWQNLRRGRYVEFNLVYDRGTKFGLDTQGRTESILMSMPPLAEWAYNHQPIKKSKEEFTLNHLKKGINWIAND